MPIRRRRLEPRPFAVAGWRQPIPTPPVKTDGYLKQLDSAQSPLRGLSCFARADHESPEGFGFRSLDQLVVGFNRRRRLSCFALADHESPEGFGFRSLDQLAVGFNRRRRSRGSHRACP